MNVVLYGATENPGQRILKELANRGHHVTAVARDTSKIPSTIKAVKDDLSSVEAIASIIAGADVVQQYNVLRILRGAGTEGLCRNEISARMVAAAPDMSRLLDRMEKSGWITRERAEDDRNTVHADTGSSLQVRHGLAFLTVLLSLSTASIAQNQSEAQSPGSESIIHVTQVLGFGGAKHNAAGDLKIQGGVL